MKVISFGSSSRGNSYLLDDGESCLLIECGFAYKPMVQMLRDAGRSLGQLSGVLISHEHDDHAKCWEKLVDFGLRVYASDGTIAALAEKGSRMLAGQMIPLAPAQGQDISQAVAIGSYDVIAFRTFHDAAEPIGFLIRSRADGEKLAFAIDTVNIRYRFPGVNKLMLEANYDEYFLSRHDRLPESVLKRIRNTHMSIDTLCEYLGALDLSACTGLYLMHLSRASSDEYVFYKKVRAVIPDHVEVIIFPEGGPKKAR